MGQPFPIKPMRTNLKELYQVGLVVRDLDRSVEQYRNTLGINDWQCLSTDDFVILEAKYRGRPAQYRFKVAFGMSGPLQIELIQHIAGDTIYRDFLEEHGEGVHHLGHIRTDDLDRTIQGFEEQGFPSIQSGRAIGAGGYAYIDTTKGLGVVTEVIEPADGPAPGYPEWLWNAWHRRVRREPKVGSWADLIPALFQDGSEKEG